MWAGRGGRSLLALTSRTLPVRQPTPPLATKGCAGVRWVLGFGEGGDRFYSHGPMLGRSIALPWLFCMEVPPVLSISSRRYFLFRSSLLSKYFRVSYFCMQTLELSVNLLPVSSPLRNISYFPLASRNFYQIGAAQRACSTSSRNANIFVSMEQVFE